MTDKNREKIADYKKQAENNNSITALFSAEFRKMLKSTMTSIGSNNGNCEEDV